MQFKNNLLSGFILGILLPASVFFMLLQVFSLLEIRGAASSYGLSEDFRERTLALVALTINLLPMRIFQRRREDLGIRGIVVATSFLALLWMIRFSPGLL
jgi:hypothetical protein